MPRPKRIKVASSQPPPSRVSKAINPSESAKQLHNTSKNTTARVLKESDKNSQNITATMLEAKKMAPKGAKSKNVTSNVVKGTTRRKAPVKPTEDIKKDTTKRRATRATSKPTKNAKATKTQLKGQKKAGEEVQREEAQEEAQEEVQKGLQEEYVQSAALDVIQVASSDPTPPNTSSNPPPQHQKSESSSVIHQTDLPPRTRIQETPTRETSILALTNFRRRPRQPSILSLNQDDDSQNITASTDELDAALEKDLERDLDLDMDDEPFEPEDESTPLNLAKGRRSQSRIATRFTPLSTTRSQSRAGFNELYDSTPKKTTKTVQPPRDDDELYASTPKRTQIDQLQTRFNELYDSTPKKAAITVQPVSSHNELYESTPDPVSRPQPEQTITTSFTSPFSSPLSSLPSRSPSASPGSPLGKRKRATEKEVRTPFKKTTKAPPPITTAALQRMLPQRRRRRPHAGDPFTIPSDSESYIEQMELREDEDELSYIPNRTRRGGGGKVQAVKAPAKAKAAASKSAKHKTYGGRRTSDKENRRPKSRHGETVESSDDGSGGEMASIINASEELQYIAEKFREVDQWSLDFEDITASGSSPSDAR
ncbi:MAG: hypothetical protein M1834_002403 [Cirrosporium novae-zelandiae]|nr:MAG: hypothetical protein M1834_002403 [Cirrosporium novae-zelandiae]